MAYIQSGMTLISRFLPLTIDENGTMSVTLRQGWIDGEGNWRQQTNNTFTMSAADVAAFMQVHGDGTKTRYEDITNQLCLYAVAHGFATGTVVAES